MISSEAQRTLVKSPPELWTELSVPAALARHLGEFGDIRITRSEPELLVEWEGDRARGQVLLKPSGWGTRVTLTVTGELAGEDPQPPSDAPDEPTFEDRQPAEAPLTEFAPAEEMPAAGVAVPADAMAVPADAMAVPAAGAAVPDAAMAVPAEPQSPPDAVEEAALTTELRASEPQTETDPDPDPDPDPGVEDEPATALAPGSPAPETHPFGDRPEPELQAPAKRGFFARLFGRSARAEEAQPTSEAPVPPLGPASTFAGGEPELADDDGMPDGAIETTGAAATIEALEAREEPGPPAPEERPEQGEMAAFTDVPEPTAAEFEPAAAEFDAALTGLGTGTQEVAAQAQAALSAELLSVEEAAAEQVNLVLTSVLDRLGSAHHRPFSRS